jgi:excisionase family DNA binding protein
MSAGEVARAVGVRPVTVRKWAARGRIPSDRTVGGHRRFSLDEVRTALRPLGHQVEEAVAALRQAIIGWAVPPLHVSVFGSVARGTAGRTSDLDLFVVLPTFSSADGRRAYGRQMVELHFTVDQLLHRDLREVELDMRQLEQAVRSGSSLLVDLLREGRLVHGAPLRQLLEPIVHRLEASSTDDAA